jgi:hypothetical protein
MTPPDDEPLYRKWTDNQRAKVVDWIHDHWAEYEMEGFSDTVKYEAISQSLDPKIFWYGRPPLLKVRSCVKGYLKKNYDSWKQKFTNPEGGVLEGKEKEHLEGKSQHGLELLTV